ncbi:MAG TPA: hypothetical protein VG269_02710 [Tepidisphaeraceae bacterium]|jgi:hypothetical protein|nr:hypothetical protein [Tepidisphaeraceae bacterium]
MSNDDMNELEEQVEPAENLDETLDETDPSYVAGARKPVSRGTIGGLTLLLACGAGMYFLYLRHGPQSAAAATPESIQANSAITEFLTGDTGSVSLMKQTLKDTEKVVLEFRSHTGKPQVPVEDLKTNPFRESVPVAKPATDDQNEAMSKRRYEEERQAALRTAQTLQLQSVLLGSRRACMINNTLYQEGQEVEGFTIEKVSPSTVLVHKGMFRFELRMTK